jgi:hypothetical protein
MLPSKLISIVFKKKFRAKLCAFSAEKPNATIACRKLS